MSSRLGSRTPASRRSRPRRRRAARPARRFGVGLGEQHVVQGIAEQVFLARRRRRHVQRAGTQKRLAPSANAARRSRRWRRTPPHRSRHAPGRRARPRQTRLLARLPVARLQAMNDGSPAQGNSDYRQAACRPSLRRRSHCLSLGCPNLARLLRLRPVALAEHLAKHQANDVIRCHVALPARTLCARHRRKVHRQVASVEAANLANKIGRIVARPRDATPRRNRHGHGTA